MKTNFYIFGILALCLVVSQACTVGPKRQIKEEGTQTSTPPIKNEPDRMPFDSTPKGAECPADSRGIQCLAQSCEAAGGEFNPQLSECFCPAGRLFSTEAGIPECKIVMSNSQLDKLLESSASGNVIRPYMSPLAATAFEDQISLGLSRFPWRLALSGYHYLETARPNTRRNPEFSMSSVTRYISGQSGFRTHILQGIYEPEFRYLPAALGISQLEGADARSFERLSAPRDAMGPNILYDSLLNIYEEYKNRARNAPPSKMQTRITYSQDETGCNTHCITSDYIQVNLGQTEGDFFAQYKKVYTYGTPYARMITVQDRSNNAIKAVILLNVADTVSLVHLFEDTGSKVKHTLRDRNGEKLAEFEWENIQLLHHHLKAILRSSP